MAKLKRIGGFLVFPVIGFALWKFREPLAAKLADANPAWLLAAALVALVYLPLNASVWGRILQLMGERVTRRDAARLWIRCEAMRWLPGGIWGYASRVVEAREIGLSPLRGAVSLSLELLVTIAAWATLAVGGLAFSGYLWVLLETAGPWLVVAGLVTMAGAGMAFLFRAELGRLLQRRFGDLTPLRRNPSRFIAPWLEYLVVNSFLALGLWFCFLAIHTSPVPGLAQVLGANAAAWIAGFFAIFAPGGLGVREGVFALLFQPAGIAAEAATAAILWRAIQTGAELVWLTAIHFLPERPLHSFQAVASPRNRV